MSEYTCFKCKQTFLTGDNEEWNSFKAAEEMLRLYPETKNDPTDVLCDDCNQEFVKWFATLTEEEKRKMRENF